MKSLEAPSLSFREYRFPIVALGLFIILVIYSLCSKVFYLQPFSSSYYRFYPQGLGFFISDLSMFNYHTVEKSEALIVSSFPEKIQNNARIVVRPALVLAEKYQLDPFWVLSIIWTESHFKLKAKSHKGAKGLMQLMPQTYEFAINQIRLEGGVLEVDRDMHYLRNRYAVSIEQLGMKEFKQKLLNLEAGVFYLRYLMNNFSGNYLHSTVAYNMGPFWTKYRLKNNLPVGKKNRYLSKVMSGYFHLTQELSLGSSFKLVASHP